MESGWGIIYWGSLSSPGLEANTNGIVKQESRLGDTEVSLLKKGNSKFWEAGSYKDGLFIDSLSRGNSLQEAASCLQEPLHLECGSSKRNEGPFLCIKVITPQAG